MAERKLILIRHGQTDYNAAGRMQGQLDTPLSPVGVAQAREVAQVTKDWDVSAVVSSDLVRAVDTAQILADAWGTHVQTDPRFRETHLGRWQGGTRHEIDRNFPGQRAYWRHDPQWAPPEGESRLQVAERAHAAIEDLMATDAFSGTVVVVAHGGTIAALTSRLVGVPAEHYPMFARLGNACWVELMARPEFSFSSIQDANSADALTTPAVDGSQVPLVPRPPADWWKQPRWFLEGWNVGLATLGQQVSNPDEGADEDDGDEGAQ